MAKTKPNKSKSKSSDKSSLNRTTPTPTKPHSPPASATSLLEKATACLQEGDITSAVPYAQRALGLTDVSSVASLPALSLLGEIHVELGDIDAARTYFTQAAEIDEDGEVSEELGGGAEKFFWLAQLSEQGGVDSVEWFEKGASVLRRQIQNLLDETKVRGSVPEGLEVLLEEKRRKLATALCGIVEVYMTELSWEEDAEQKCESLVTEATMVAPEFPDSWQTLASVRISQQRVDDARAALKRSLDLWKDLPPDDEHVPDFPARVSLARLLLEVEMEEEALEVLERLVGEDDESVEVWYLGGWGLYIMGDKLRNGTSQQGSDQSGDAYKVSWISSRQWLNHSMRLFEMQDYEDERLGQHAKELLALLDNDLGGPVRDADEEEDDEGVEEDDDIEDEDEEMEGA